MADESQIPIKRIPSLLDVASLQPSDGAQDAEQSLFYTCPQCGHAMVTKKCKIVCRKCHYFIGCVE